MSAFGDVGHVTEGWYVLARSRALKPGRIVTVPVGTREVVAYRSVDGGAHALDAHCGHLGMHLAKGTVAADGLQCGFHGWCWGDDGACVRAPGHEKPPARRTRAYDVVEKWGLVWAWLGRGGPAYDVPGADIDPTWQALPLRPQVVRCHPHLVLGNGYDMAHLAPAHGFQLERAPDVDVDPPHRMRIATEGTLPRAGSIRLLGMGGREFRTTYRTYGASVTVVDVETPHPFRVLFTGRPDAAGHTRAQTILFLPGLAKLPKALALLWTTTLQDIRILESLRFRPAFDAGDEVLARYVRLVEAMPAW